jgi:hypothetical protein
MTAWKTNPIVVDLSHYNIADISLMKGNVDLIIAKAGEMVPTYTEFEQYDYKFALNCQAAYDNGIPFGAYIFLTPDDWICNQKTGGLPAYKALTRADDKEYQLYRKWVANKVLCVHVIDLEKCYIGGALVNGVIPTGWIIANLDVFYNHLKEGIKAKEIQDAPIFLYSGEWYADGFCVVGSGVNQTNALYDWVAAHPEVYIWSASYPTLNTIPLVTWAQVREKMILQDTWKPPYLNSSTMPLLWQFNAKGGMKVLTDYTGTKPNYRETDISACSVSKEKLYEILKVGQVAPPPVVIPPVVIPPAPETPPTDLAELTARVIILEARMDKFKTI